MLFRILRSLYGPPESGMHWFATYDNHHRDNLSMVASPHYPCLLYTPKYFDFQNYLTDMHGLTCLQTEDALNLGDESFINKKETCSKFFECKLFRFLINQRYFNFNGVTTSVQEKYVTLSQPRHVAKLPKLCETEIDLFSFGSHHALGVYLAFVARLDLTYSFSESSQVLTPNKNVIRFIKRLSTSPRINTQVCCALFHSSSNRFVFSCLLMQVSHLTKTTRLSSGLLLPLRTNGIRQIFCTIVASKLSEWHEVLWLSSSLLLCMRSTSRQPYEQR